MDVLVAPGLAPPATLPPELVAAQGIAMLRLGSASWATLPTDDPANTVWGARILGDVDSPQALLAYQAAKRARKAAARAAAAPRR